MTALKGGAAARRQLSDVGAVALAVGAGLGASAAFPVPVWPALAVAIAVFVARRPVLLFVAVTALASGLAAQALAGAHPAAEGPLAGRAVVLTDPAPMAGAVRAEVRVAGHHFDLWARGPAAAALRNVMAGQEIDLAGTVTPRAATDDYQLHRHIVGRLTAERLQRRGAGNTVAQVANQVRAVLERGAEVLPRERRVLFAGFVLGDTRDESVTTEDDFRGAGLGHLLVVSGENVAFVLAAVAPLVRRLGSPGRWVLTLAVLGLFAVMTRFEPSVLRATVMAALAVTAWALGRPVTGIRILALCVTGLVLADPLLVGVLGFRLSVAASAGILVLARPLTAALPLPRWVASMVAVTLAAQLGVAPLLVMRPGGLPVAALPANVAAEPAAAAVMAWGLTGGLVAGLSGGLVATVLHVPSTLLLWWVASVARWAAHLGLGDLSPAALVAAAVIGGAAVLAHRRRRSYEAVVLWLAVVAVLAVPGWLERTPPRRTALPGVGTLWRSRPGDGAVAAVLVLEAGARPLDVLGGLRRAGVSRLDLVVVPRGTRTAEALITTIASRVRIDRIWVPASGPTGAGTQSGPAGRGGEVAHPRQADEAELGGLHLVVTADTPTLEVEITVDSETATDGGVGSAGAPRARSPPLRRDPSGRRDGHPQPHA